MSTLKYILKNSLEKTIMYQYLKKEKDIYREKEKFKFSGTYIDRSKGYDKLCIVLAGYKEFAYSAVFGRLKKYQMPDMDVCIISSGLFSEKLQEICEKNNWSYLSTERNHVGLVQNIAISKHPKAKYIFKLDEDIFITEHYFENMLKAYMHAQNGKYIPGIMAPMLNINGFSYAKILEKLNLVSIYEKKFGKFKYATGPSNAIENNTELAKFMWGEGGDVPNIDELNSKFSKEELCECPCPYRFSIGAILFERKLWEDMGCFSVDSNGAGMGVDEEEIDRYCFMNSKVIMISENIVVGHLSFGKQNSVMKEYFLNHPEIFE